MSEVWCVSECQPDEEVPEIQHITIRAYADGNVAEMHIGANGLRMFDEDRNGLRLARMTLLRYATPDFTIDGMDSNDIETVWSADDEARHIMQAMRKANGITGSRKSCGLIMGKSVHVLPHMRGQGIMTRIMQEIRQLHAGMPFHYAHRSIPQEGASQGPDFQRRLIQLQNGYIRAGIGLHVPDKDEWPEIMLAHWDGTQAQVDQCNVDWNKVAMKLQDMPTRLAA